MPNFTWLSIVFRPDFSKPKTSKQRLTDMKIHTENLAGRGHKNVAQPCLETLLREKLFIYSSIH